MKVKIDDVNKLFKSIILTAFILISGTYFAYVIAKSTESFTIMILIMFLGTFAGIILTFKLSEEKLGYLIAAAFVLVTIFGAAIALIIGKRLDVVNLLSLTPDKYSLALNGITILLGIIGFISGCILNIGIKKMKESRLKYDEYLVCKKCNRYYQLQPGESPDDPQNRRFWDPGNSVSEGFSDTCDCGGKLEYKREF